MPRVTVPTLTDGVATLRAHAEDDVDALVEQWQDPLTQAWTTMPVPYTRDDAKRFVRQVAPEGWARDQVWTFAIEAAAEPGRYVGSTMLRDHDDRRAEIAFASLPHVRGTGLMERALRLILAWGFAERDLATIAWFAYPGNWQSRRLVWKVGFSFDGVLRGWIDQRGELRDAWTGTLRAGEPMEPRQPWLDVPRIEGERVRLRRHRPDDAERAWEGATDARTRHWLGRLPDPYPRELAEDFIVHRSEGMAAGTDLHWMLADPDTDLLMGTISLMHIAEGMAEVGYWAHPEARGRGLMTEAVRMASRHAFIDPEDGGLGLHRVHATVAVDNVASRHVLETNGYSLVGTERRSVIVRDGMHDGAVYELLVGDLRDR